MDVVKATVKGQILIPASLRRKYHLNLAQKRAHLTAVANRFFENFPARNIKPTSYQTGEAFFCNLAAQCMLFRPNLHFVQEISCTQHYPKASAR